MRTGYLMRCAGVAIGVTLAGATVVNAEQIYGVTLNQTLVTWDSATPGTVNFGAAINGLASNEEIRGIDFRPATGELYALGSFNNLYTINPMTGSASLVGGGNFSPGLNGSSFGFDFNPTIDRIRVVSETNQNLVLDPNDGTSTQATPLFYGAGDTNFGVDPNVVGSAYTNSFAGAMTTQLYGIDTGLDILVTQANSAGTLATVGPIGADLGDLLGFDISGGTGIAYAMVLDEMSSQSTFWTIDLMTGAASPLGTIGGGSMITAMAVVPTPGSAAILAMGGMIASRRRRTMN